MRPYMNRWCFFLAHLIKASESTVLSTTRHRLIPTPASHRTISHCPAQLLFGHYLPVINIRLFTHIVCPIVIVATQLLPPCHFCLLVSSTMYTCHFLSAHRIGNLPSLPVSDFGCRWQPCRHLRVSVKRKPTQGHSKSHRSLFSSGSITEDAKKSAPSKTSIDRMDPFTWSRHWDSKQKINSGYFDDNWI